MNAESWHRRDPLVACANGQSGSESFTNQALLGGCLTNFPVKGCRSDLASIVVASPSLNLAARWVQVKMVTGDQLAIAIETSKRLGLGTNIMEGKQLMASKTLGTELMVQVNEVCFRCRPDNPGHALTAAHDAYHQV